MLCILCIYIMYIYYAYIYYVYMHSYASVRFIRDHFCIRTPVGERFSDRALRSRPASWWAADTYPLQTYSSCVSHFIHIYIYILYVYIPCKEGDNEACVYRGDVCI